MMDKSKHLNSDMDSFDPLNIPIAIRDAMEQDMKKDFETFTKDLLSFGGMWTLLAHELRGHQYFYKSDYDNALKNFNKIIQNQQATVAIRNRAIEMIDNINLYYDKDS